MALKNLIFDLDNTLVDSVAAYDKALKAIGLGLKNPLYLAARASVKKRLGERNVNARNRVIYFKEILETQKKFSPEKTLRMLEKYEHVLFREIHSQWISLGRAGLFSRLGKNIPWSSFLMRIRARSS